MHDERSQDRRGGTRAGNSLRLCAVDRVERAPDELIRFALAPDGAIVPDLGRRLPGRGVWVTASRAHVAKAASGKVFARSLKTAVVVDPHLDATVERLLERRCAETLALANKAGLVVTGFERIGERIRAGDVAVLVHGSDAAADGAGKLDRRFAAQTGEAGGCFVVAPLTIDQMSLAIGRPNVVHAALIKGGATERFRIEAGRVMRYRSGFGHRDVSHCPANADASTGIE